LNYQTEFTRILAHELRTPLTPILAASELILAEQIPEPLKSLALKINIGAHNLDKTIDEILDIAKGEIGSLTLHRQKLNPRLLITETVDYINPQACRQKKELTLDLPDFLPTIKADGRRLRQVLLNLLQNSLKFTPSSG
jgi:signal transduction histidine kinase